MRPTCQGNQREYFWKRSTAGSLVWLTDLGRWELPFDCKPHWRVRLWDVSENGFSDAQGVETGLYRL